MIGLRSEDTIHRSHLNRLLIEIADHQQLASKFAFKGGTCAAMLGFLDRFSVDLDFDYLNNKDLDWIRTEIKKIFHQMGLKIVKEFNHQILFSLSYPSAVGQRNTLKISVIDPMIKSNQYQVQYFPEIDRLINSQTIESMFANKLVAVMDRYRIYQKIAGRDIYDIHHFLVKGYAYLQTVIEDRSGLSISDFLKSLAEFIKVKVSQKQINEDLNTLLPLDRFQQIRKVLIPETIHLLSKEAMSLSRRAK